ncbi:MAG: hypothetical protein N2053_06225, partial [Chitinispirillaceae bacterium]|nr:hypothetical protein [Chitinispirillaceae bacterium]
PITIGKLPFAIPALTTPIQKILDDVSISVYKDAHLTMRHTILLDTSTNINFTEKTSTFVIDSLKCSGNKLSIADTVLFIGKDIVVSASRENQRLILPPPSNLSSVKLDVDNKTMIQQKKFPILPFQIIAGAGAIVCGGIAIYCHRKVDYFYNRYPHETNPDIVEWCQDEYYRYQKYRNVTIIGSALCSVFFTATFFIDIK